ncbi:hypothetical protein HDEF_0320 [Candidatus Hamiltonella defensa 5AT (Acyrthosiphon pisum)]|uniref:Uncharacterized protein n=1 Tax=Hamiltonella defensa subsp. Acyrthosiphon pisum (strain 5AT) TaxID=572265 RepID=C4K3D9_HAMD5|nr:hypothetical protein HDEF_0320 [Candidatus Hamiltonella defensa 5AT (Acyrthosiphon pisum)]
MNDVGFFKIILVYFCCFLKSTLQKINKFFLRFIHFFK